jgi:hypothetical protein
MRRITITKSKAGHYWLTVRNPDGSLLVRQMCDTLTIARRAAAPYRMPSEADYLAAIGPCGR